MGNSQGNPLKRIVREIHRRSLWQVLSVYVVASWVALQVVDILVDNFDLPEWFPAFALGLLIVGLPIVLATAFVQEGGPAATGSSVPLIDAGGREIQARGSTSESASPARRLLTWRNAIVGGLAALALWGILATGWLVFGGAAPANEADTASPRPSLAVLPFENLSPDPDNAYFAAGIHEEMLTQLSRVEGIDLISRRSVMAYEDAEKRLSEIAEELDVSTILEGSVQRSGDQVRITVQLNDAREDEKLWAQSYERQLSDVFQIQADVATRVVQELKGVLTPEERAELARRPTDNLEAYAHYLRGHEHRWSLWVEEDARTAAQAYERAVALDPDFADAWARVVQARLWLAWDHGDYDGRARARAALDRLERTAPNSPQLHLARGLWLYYGVQRHEEALREFEILAGLWPGDVDVSTYQAALYRRLGRWDQAVRTWESDLDVDPANATIAASLAQTYGMMRRFEEAERYGKLAVSLDPEVAIHWWFLTGYSHLSRGDTAAARSAVDSAAHHLDEESLAPEWAMVHFYSGRPEEAIGFYREPLLRGFGIPEIGLVAAAAAGRSETARAYADTLRILARETLSAVPSDYAVVSSRALSQLAVANAYLGREEAALQNAREAVELYPVSRDAFFGPRRVLWEAHVYAVVGRHDEAVERLRYLLSIPTEMLTVPLLKTDSRWDPLREHPGFRALLEDNE